MAESRWTWQRHVETCSLCAQLKPASFLIYTLGQRGPKMTHFSPYVSSPAACQQFKENTSKYKSQPHFILEPEVSQKVESKIAHLYHILHFL